MRCFDFERLDVYRVAVAFTGVADSLALRLPVGRAYIADQLRRAALSIVNNVAEGAGEIAPREERRFYRMARRSATECAAILGVCVSLGVLSEDAVHEGRKLCLRVVEMLSRLTREPT